jgi:hypothetical protein
VFFQRSQPFFKPTNPRFGFGFVEVTSDLLSSRILI